MFEPLRARHHHGNEDVSDLVDWLERCRPEIETEMALLRCTPAEAVMIMLLNRVATEAIEINESPPGDEWKNGGEDGT